jgi:hypothetical protein
MNHRLFGTRHFAVSTCTPATIEYTTGSHAVELSVTQVLPPGAMLSQVLQKQPHGKTLVRSANPLVWDLTRG